MPRIDALKRVLLVVVLTAVAAAAAVVVIGLPDGVVLTIQEAQRRFHGLLVSGIGTVRDQGIMAAGGLVAASFAYGVFHAAGPGHGKFVISTYLVTNDADLRRGIALSTAAAMIQGLTAVLAVGALVWLLGATPRAAQAAAVELERSSYVLVALFGGVLAAAAGRRLWRHRSEAARPTHGAHGHHHHDGCAHGPDAASLAGARSWRQMAALVFAVGLRPCSGAILVLIFAQTVGLPAAGIAAVFAMAAGTALTVAVLAVVAVHARRLALRLGLLLGGGQSGSLWLWLDAAALAGGIAIIAVGLVLFEATGAVVRHPLL